MTMRTITAKIAVAALFIMTLSSCTSKLLDSIKDDVDEQKLADIIAEQDGNTPETKKPTITVFQWVGGITTTNNPSVLFNIDAKANAVSASGPATLSAWYVSESLDVPEADDAKWSATQPTSYSFSCVNGKRTIYARVRDSLGNVSAAATLSVDLAPLGVDWNGSLVSGQEIAAHESLSFTARENLSASGITVTGTMGAGLATASGTGNAIVTVKPGAAGTGLWQAGSGTITVHCVTAYGLPLDATIALSPFNGVCVSTTGSDSNDGGVLSPCKSIAVGINKAAAKYGTSGSVVRVAKGTYSIDSSDASQQIKLAAGVTVKGEYSADFQAFTPAAANQFRSTIVKDTRATDGTATENATTSTVLFNGLSSTAGISYLKIEGASVSYCPIVQCIDSPAVIDHCDVINGGGANERYAIRIYGASSPTIQFNNVNYDPSTASVIGGSSSVTRGVGIRFYAYSGGAGIVSENYLSGGNGSTSDINATTAGITTGSGSGSVTIRANKIIAGSAYCTYSIQTFLVTNMMLSIYNNLMICGNGTLSYGLQLVSSVAYTPTYLIRNNTIILGEPATSLTAEFGVGLSGIDSSDNVRIENNLFYAPAVNNYACAIYELLPQTIASLRNNLFINFDNPALARIAIWGRDDDGSLTNGFINYDSISSIDSLLGISVSSGNYLDVESRINYLSDFSFISANTNGLDGSALGWGFTSDFHGNRRTGNETTGWSVGYLEKD
jgi:hypothetical protein